MWEKPIKNCPGIPFGFHPGAFGFKRKYEHHTGVDLYTSSGETVYAMEDGVIVCITKFTGKNDNSPWWRDTDCVLIKGNSGVICYGEIISNLKVGDFIKTGDQIAKVETVLHEGKERPDIPGHSRSMLHIELYPSDKMEPSTPWYLNDEKPSYLLDPTEYLLSTGFEKLPEWRKA